VVIFVKQLQTLVKHCDRHNSAALTSAMSPTVISRDNPPPGSASNKEDLIGVLLLGLTGSGKSTFISLLTEQNVVIGDRLTSGTTEIHGYNSSVLGQKVTLIDTPGFDHTNKSDVEILRDISVFLGVLYRFHVRLVGIIYFQRITDIRMSGSSLKSIGIVERLCGLKACPGMTVVTTMWETLQMAEGGIEEGTARERQLLQNTSFGTLVNNGANFRRHLGSKESAECIVADLVRKNATIVLDIQRQLLDDRLILGETPAGRYVQEGVSNGHQSTSSQLIKEEHDQQPNHTQQLEIGCQGLTMNLDQLVEYKISEYEHASLLELDRSMEEESELLSSARAQLSNLQREIDTQIHQDELRLGQHTIDEMRIFQQTLREYNQCDLAVRFYQSRRRCWMSFRLCTFHNCI